MGRKALPPCPKPATKLVRSSPLRVHPKVGWIREKVAMAPQHPALEQGPIGDGVWVIVDPAAGGLREEEVGEWLLENSDTFVSLTSKDGTTSKGVVRLTDDRIMLCEWRRGKRSKLQSKDDSRVGSSTSRAEDPYAMP